MRGREVAVEVAFPEDGASVFAPHRDDVSGLDLVGAEGFREFAREV